MTERWRESVEENRDRLERIAAADLPISADVEELLDRAEDNSGGEPA
jgi:hypothetical protein